MFTAYRGTISKRDRAKLNEIKAGLEKTNAWACAASGQMAEGCGRKTQPVLWSACEQSVIVLLPVSGSPTLVSVAEAAESAARLTWEQMYRLIERWLPPPRIHHPYPLRRLGVTLRRSRMR